MKISIFCLILMVCMTLVLARRHRPKPDSDIPTQPHRPRPPIPHRPSRPRQKRETKDSHATGTCTVKVLTKQQNNHGKKKSKPPEEPTPISVMMPASPMKRLPLFMNSKFLQFMLSD